MAIKTFADPDTKRLFQRKRVQRFGPELQHAALKMLLILHAATQLDDLRLPPGNRLEPLTGDRAGQHSIRINAQWRLCFCWDDGHAHEAEIIDYH